MKHSALSALGRRTTAAPISWLMRQTLEQPHLISLAAGFTDDASLPVLPTRRSLARLLGHPDTAAPALQYGTTAGDPELRALSGARVATLDGRERAPEAVYRADRVLITHGSQQMLYLLAEALCDPGDIVLVEDPTYLVLLGLIQSRGCECRGIRLTPEGWDLEQLAAVLEALRRTRRLARLKLFYAVTYHQNPTGHTAPLAHKAAALALLRSAERAAGHPIYFLEDAAYRELGFAPGSEPSALAVPGAAERVIYVGTYSKPFATGIRIGFGLLPKALAGVATWLKGNHDFGTSHFLQRLLAQVLRSGEYDRHLAVLRRRYAAKAECMASALTRHAPGAVKWRRPEGGLYFWAQLPASVATGLKSRLFREALNRGVLYVPGELCYAEDPTRPRLRHAMRLSYGQVTEAAMTEGVARLGAVCRERLR